MKRLDQSCLHPLINHPETYMTWPGNKPGPPMWKADTLSKIYSQPRYTLTIRDLHMAAPVDVAHDTRTSRGKQVHMQDGQVTRMAQPYNKVTESVAHHVGVTTMKILDQNTLHPLIKHTEADMSRQGPPQWEASTLPKSLPARYLSYCWRPLNHETINERALMPEKPGTNVRG